MTEEDILKQKFGTANHFQVPEGFFDRFAEEMMAKIEPETAAKQPTRMPAGRKAMVKRLVPYLAVASVVGLLFGVAVFHTPESDEQQHSGQFVMASSPSEDALDQMADYAMLDNQDLYSYLSNDY